MKRIFSILCILLIILSLMGISCYAQEIEKNEEGVTGETQDTLTEDTAEDVIRDDTGDENVGDVESANPIEQIPDWLTEFWEMIMNNKDDVMAGILLVVATLYELGAKRLKKKVLPAIEAQAETTANVATAAGKIVKANRENYERAIQALEASEQTQAQYREMCEQYKEQNEKTIAASLALEQMIYESLMSAKISDLRKEEIERQHLKCKQHYEDLSKDLNGGDQDEAMGS